jgi:hypothetical protein
MKSIVTDDMKLLLRASDAAIVCGCTTRIWRQWDLLGYTPIPVKIGRSVFWRYKEIDRWIDAGCPRREEWLHHEKNKNL